MFAFHALLSIVWFSCAALVAKLIGFIGTQLTFSVYVADYIFRMLQVFMLTLGAVISVVYFVTEAYSLVSKIAKDIHDDEPSRPE